MMHYIYGTMTDNLYGTMGWFGFPIMSFFWIVGVFLFSVIFWWVYTLMVKQKR